MPYLQAVCITGVIQSSPKCNALASLLHRAENPDPKIGRVRRPPQMSMQKVRPGLTIVSVVSKLVDLSSSCLLVG